MRTAAAGCPPEFGRHADDGRGVYQVRGQAHQAQFPDDQPQHDGQVKRRQVGRDRHIVVHRHGPVVFRKTCGTKNENCRGNAALPLLL